MHAHPGVKLSQLPHLKALMDYEAKQKRKCSRIMLRVLTNSPSKWVEQFVQLAGHSPKFEAISGQRMLQLTSEDLRCEFDMASNVDRQYSSCLHDPPCYSGPSAWPNGS